MTERTRSPIPGEPDEVVIIGAGPAGLTAAYELLRRGKRSTVLEADDVVGGISRTAVRDGWRFDIGGHRFFTKVERVERFWHEILPDEDFMLRPRMSRILYRGKKYDYPLKAMNALRNLGVLESVRCVLSYGWARIHPPKDQSMYEGWLAARFGWRLYRHFFKTYTERVWGHPASQMPADWAAQRVKNLSLSKAIVNAILPKRNQKDITSLIEEFQYPRLGPGMMWERCRDKVEAGGTSVVLHSWVVEVRHEHGRAVSVVADTDGVRREYPASAVVSSMPLAELARCFEPPVPAAVRKAAEGLSYRDYFTVALVVPQEYSFPDNWIYIHDPDVNVGRIQNYGSWSPYLVKEGRTCLGLEYFVFEDDDLWKKPDDELIEMGKKELAQLGLVDPDKIEAGYLVRMLKAYPYYDVDYKANVETIRSWIAANCPNVYPVGRNGMHRYNNQDHSMYTAMLSVENMFGAGHDVWSVNVEEDYHEEASTPRGATDGSGAGRSGTGGSGTGRSGAGGSGTGRSGTGGSGTGRDAPILPKRPPRNP